jgi:AhpD family alkylhydroperoxidase
VPDESARITLASDAEMQTAAKLSQPQPDLKKGLGIGIANSQRAMLRVPDIAAAWWGYWQSVRDSASLQRPMLLQISFAVSMANGCRYCTLHQVAGLRRVGVEPAKLLAMQKDDNALDAREKAAVTFARKLTKSATTMTEQDFTALQSGLGNEKEAIDALMQTCAFSFMNRFTDGLRLPSEEEAVRVYQEVYGKGAYRAFPVR